MRVLQIIETLNIGGAENFTVQLSNELCKSNEVIIISTHDSKDGSNFHSNLDKRIGVRELNWKKKYSFKQLLHLNKEIKKIKPNIIHVHLHNSFYYLFALSIFNKRLKIVNTIHSNINVWKPVLKWINKLRFISKSITHVCISKSISTQFSKNYPKLRVHQINNGIIEFSPKRKLEDVKKFWNEVCGTSEPEVCVKLLAIGNISGLKNFVLLTKAIKNIKEKYPNVKCALVGRTANQDLVNEIESIKTENLKLMGPHLNAADFLTGSDALIISSIQEGMPIVALEALSLSKPIISTPAGGMVDIVIEGSNGFISKDFEVDSFIIAIENYLRLSKDEITRMQERAFATFKNNYKIEEISKKYISLYNDLVEK